jgi:hypothetical protein
MMVWSAARTTTGPIRDPFTRRVIVPERLRGTPEERQRLIQYTIEGLAVPLAQVYRAGREDEPMPEGFLRQWASEVVSEKALGVRRVDLEAARRFAYRDIQDRFEALRNSVLDKIEQAHVRAYAEGNPAIAEQGTQEAIAWLKGEVAKAWRQSGYPGEPPSVAPTAGQVAERLRSPRVQALMIHERLRRETDPEQRKMLFEKLREIESRGERKSLKSLPRTIRRIPPPTKGMPSRDPLEGLFPPAQ